MYHHTHGFLCDFKKQSQSNYLFSLLAGIMLFAAACQPSDQSDEIYMQETKPIDSAALHNRGIELLRAGKAEIQTYRTTSEQGHVLSAVRLFAHASDTLLMAGSYEKAYEAGRLEIGFLVPLDRLDEAILRFEACRKYTLPDTCFEKAQLYNNAAGTYGELNFTRLSSSLLDTVAHILRLRESLGIESKYEPAMRFHVQLNRGLVNFQLGEYATTAGLAAYGHSFFDTTTVRLRKALELANQLPDYHTGFRSQWIASTNDNYSLLLSAQGNDKAAISHQQRANAFRIARQQEGTYEQNLGDIYFNQGNYHEAVKYLVNAVQKIDDAYQEDSYLQLEPLLNLGKIHTQWGQYDKAIAYFQQAIQQLRIDQTANQTGNYPTFEQVHDAIDYLMVLEAVSKTFNQHLDKQQQLDNIKFQDLYRAAMQLMKKLQQVAYNDEVTYMLSSYGKSIIDDYLAYGHHASIEEAFLMLEQNRANFLYRNLGFREQGIMEDQHIDAVPTDHPDLAGIQAMLLPDQLLLEYFWGEETMYIFKISSSHVELIPQPIGSLAHHIQDLHESLRVKPFTKEMPAGQFIEPAHILYQKLLAPALEGDSTSYSKIVIIPDEEIGYVAFSALLKKLPPSNFNLRKLAYAGKDHAFSFAYSARLWAYEKQRPQTWDKKHHKLLAIAPFASSDQDPVQLVSNTPKQKVLSSSKEQVLGIQARHKTILLNEAATIDAFQELISTHSLLHFGSHAMANGAFPDSSALYFAYNSSGKHHLSPEEISTLALDHIEMIVLSACETALGPTVAGEGTLSLARAFTMAGAHGVIASLWKVRDDATAKLMQQFYQHLPLEKDIALQKAQRHLIEEGSGPHHAHPHYWAAFMQMGNIRPIDLGSRNVFEKFLGRLTNQ